MAFSANYLPLPSLRCLPVQYCCFFCSTYFWILILGSSSSLGYSGTGGGDDFSEALRELSEVFFFRLRADI